MLENLREATQQLHKDIEQDNLAALIMTHNISVDEYKLLLLQNYIAYKFTEAEIEKHFPDWSSDKSTRLKKDLENLNVDTSIAAEFENKFSINNEAEALGATYVLEGSALGGMQIAKEIQHCTSLSHLQPQHFFTPERKSMEGWNIFLKKLRHSEFSEKEVIAASKKAQDTFVFFGAIFRFSFKLT